MAHVQVVLSMDEIFLKRIDKRVAELAINRSEYLRRCVLDNLEEAKQ